MITAPEIAARYRLVYESTDCPRISAVDADGIEICGAYQPRGHSDWVVYTTMNVTKVTGLRPPAHAHLLNRTGAQTWVETIGALYGQATA